MRYKSRAAKAAVLSSSVPALLSPEAIAALSSWWEMDEASGTRFDSHGTAHLDNVAAVLAPTITPLYGNAVRMNLGSPRMQADTPAGLYTAGGHDFTICGWFSKGNTSGDGKIFICRNSVTAREYSLMIAGNGNLRVQMGTAGGGAENLDYVTQPGLNTWHFVTIWHEHATQTVYMQMDGGTKVTRSYTVTVTEVASLRFRMGSAMNGTNDLAGHMDEVCMFYDYLLPDVDRDALYNGGLGVTYGMAVGA